MKPFDYTACYCEENIWHLCGHPELSGTVRKVVWISSLAGVCPLWQQRAARAPDQPVWWDYHVVLLVKRRQWQVWDLDTTLPLPVSATEYLQKTFNDIGPVEPLFRVMDADYYLLQFSSDRSHMRDASGSWLATPPVWSTILPHAPTFAAMLDFTKTGHGEIMSLTQLRAMINESAIR